MYVRFKNLFKQNTEKNFSFYSTISLGIYISNAVLVGDPKHIQMCISNEQVSAI